MVKEYKTLIIAEAGVNHNGSLDTACQLVKSAARSGADYVKFQTFKADKVVTQSAQKARYQEEQTGDGGSQYAMLKQLELSDQDHDVLIDCCRRSGIGFLSTPFDEQSLDMLLDRGIDTIKIPSGEITNLPYLRHAGSKGVPIIISTGMATLEEVKGAIDVLTAMGTRLQDVTLLHCNTQYPTPVEDANLMAIRTLTKAFPQCRVGYSDHTSGIECSVVAIALGACVIEKHFTLDKTMAGPDHAASISPDELKAMVAGIRAVEKALGDGRKEPRPSEKENILIARRYLVASQPIDRGETFSTDNLAAMRTGKGGISPMEIDGVCGNKAKRNFLEGEVIEL